MCIYACIHRTGGGAGYTRDIGGAVNPGLRLNPDDEYVLKEGDALIVLAEDEDSYSVNPRALAELDRDVAQGTGGWGRVVEASVGPCTSLLCIACMHMHYV